MSFRRTALSVNLGQPPAVGIPPPHELGLESIEVPATHGAPNLVDQSYRPTLVVDRRQSVREKLLSLEQVVDIGAGIVGACVAVAVVLQRAEVSPEPRGINVVTPVNGVDGSCLLYTSDAADE